MFGGAPKYAVASQLVAVMCLAGCGGNGNPPPLAPSGTMSVRDQVFPGSRLAPQTGGTTFYVSEVRGSDKNDCKSPQRACKTIHRALNISTSGDTIDVAAGLYPENDTIRHGVHIIGAGSDKTIVDGGGVASEFVVAVNPNGVVTMSGMTLRNGGGSGDGGAIYNCFGTLTLQHVVMEENHIRGNGYNGYGGAMYNCPKSTATIIDSTIRNNSAQVGGAICNGGLLTVIRSTFSGNTAREDRGGGAIFTYWVLHVANSTFSGNTAAGGVGGAIHNGTLTGITGGVQIDNSTISGNTAAFGDSPGGGINNMTGLPIYVQNTIIAENSPENCSGAPLQTEGFNLSSDQSCDLDGAGDMNGVDPNLGKLQDNGGPTWTMALRPGSPAIDAGNRTGCRDWLGRLLVTDQRGMPRPDQPESSGCDIGAYERQ